LFCWLWASRQFLDVRGHPDGGQRALRPCPGRAPGSPAWSRELDPSRHPQPAPPPPHLLEVTGYAPRVLGDLRDPEAIMSHRTRAALDARPPSGLLIGACCTSCPTPTPPVGGAAARVLVRAAGWRLRTPPPRDSRRTGRTRRARSTAQQTAPGCTMRTRAECDRSSRLRTAPARPGVGVSAVAAGPGRRPDGGNRGHGTLLAGVGLKLGYPHRTGRRGYPRGGDAIRRLTVHRRPGPRSPAGATPYADAVHRGARRVRSSGRLRVSPRALRGIPGRVLPLLSAAEP